MIQAGATLLGARQKNNASQQAADTAVVAQQRATAAEVAAIQVAQGQLNEQKLQASPGLVAQQEIIGRKDQLTPFQMQQISDSRRTTLDALQGGSLRGSARATAEAVSDVEGRQVNQFLEANQSRADQAATNLSGQYFNAGNNVANLNLKAGDSVSQGLISQGDVQSANIVGRGKITGQAIGDIGAVIAEQIKKSNQEKKDSSYKPIKKEEIFWNSARKGGV